MPPAYVEEEQVRNQDTAKSMKKDTAGKSQFTSKLGEISESVLPPYSQGSTIDPTEDPVFPADMKPDFRKLATDFPESELQASIGHALQLAAENYFRGGAFEKAMSDTIHRVATIQTTYHYGRDSEESSPDDEDPAVATTHSSSVTDIDIIRSGSKGRRASQSRICHRTSATGTLFGTIWLRKTCVQVNSHTGKNVDVVSSFTFFPSWWLNRVGMKYGMEANLSSTPTGWQFNFNPIRVVPDDSPIFNACRKGSISTVQFLLAEGEASVRDTNSKGWTPLHVSSSTQCSLTDPEKLLCVGKVSNRHSLRRLQSRRLMWISANS